MKINVVYRILKVKPKKCRERVLHRDIVNYTGEIISTAGNRSMALNFGELTKEPKMKNELTKVLRLY